jgi:hypothetical protein
VGGGGFLVNLLWENETGVVLEFGPSSFEVTISRLKLSRNRAVLRAKGAVRVMYS